MKYTFAELFAGCGGMSLGLDTAGFDLIFANEISGMAAETYAYNLIHKHKTPSDDIEKWYFRLKKPLYNNINVSNNPEDYKNGKIRTDIGEYINNNGKKLFVGDIRTLIKVFNNINSKSGLPKKYFNLDLLAGGPPCQSFSIAGKREKDNNRNLLFKEYVKLVKILKPRVVLFENVSGIIKPFYSDNKKWYAFHEVAMKFFDVGYLPVCTMIDASKFGVPQNRHRFILIAVRKDIISKSYNVLDNERWGRVLNCFKETEKYFKEEKHDPKRCRIYKNSDTDWPEPLLPTPSNEIITVEKAIGDLIGKKKSDYVKRLNTEFNPPLEEWNDTEAYNHDIRNHNKKTISRFKLLQLLNESGFDKVKIKDGFIKQDHIKNLLDKELYFYIDDETRLPENEQEILNLLSLLNSNKHSQKTINKKNVAPSQLSIPDDYIHYDFNNPRTLTVREIARLQSFPDWFIFKSKVTTGGKLRSYEVPQYTQVGNAVPPLLAKRLGLCIKRFLKEIDSCN